MNLELKKLIYKAKNHDKLAISAIVHIFYPIILHLSFKIDGEDSQQDLILFLLQLVNKIPDNLSNDKIIFSYIHHSLKNECIHLQKKKYHHQQIIFLNFLSEFPDNKNNAIELIDNKCTVTHLLQKIKPSDRKLLYEIFFKNTTVKELSKKYHVSPQAIYQRYKRILGKLKS